MEHKKMKLGLLAVLFMASFSSASYAATAIGGSNAGTINISGSLTAATCTVALDKTAVNFGTLSANTMKSLANGASIKKDAASHILFTFTDCPAGNIQLALRSNALVTGSTDKGKLTIGGKATDTIYYRAYSGKAPFMALNGTTASATRNLITVSGAESVAKTIPVQFELTRGTGSMSALSGPIAGSLNYTVTYQ